MSHVIGCDFSDIIWMWLGVILAIERYLLVLLPMMAFKRNIKGTSSKSVAKFTLGTYNF